jgi:hypothetical protein
MSEPSGVCRLRVEDTPGLISEGGRLMTGIKPHTDVRGREFVDCLHARYSLRTRPLEVDVLLDAEHPGSTPAELPAMRPLVGHKGICVGPGTEGNTVARRIPGAWLLITKGKDLQQRLTLLLNNLYVEIRS